MSGAEAPSIYVHQGAIITNRDLPRAKEGAEKDGIRAEDAKNMSRGLKPY
jgi:hypothetical protein